MNKLDIVGCGWPRWGGGEHERRVRGGEVRAGQLWNSEERGRGGGGEEGGVDVCLRLLGFVHLEYISGVKEVVDKKG